jgi:hypothetical protein
MLLSSAMYFNKFKADLPEIWSKLLPIVVSVLEKYETYKEVYDSLTRW